MPTAVNKKTGQRSYVTEEQMQVIKSNPMTKKAFTFEGTEEPVEVTALKAETIGQPDLERLTVDNVKVSKPRRARRRTVKKGDNQQDTSQETI